MQQEMIVPMSKCFQTLLHSLLRAAPYDYPALLLGETGVGKEFLAHYLHENSNRKGQPFVAVNCGAIPNSLFESELFGYERGAFSGAMTNYRGLIRSAQEGTLFLDEIGDLDLSSQVKLLRFIDSGEVRSLGSLKPESISTRIVAATNANLPELISQGEFRLDLYERLSVFRFQIPPLRDRVEDLIQYADFFAKNLGSALTPECLESLKNYDWPGNVRQLKNMIIRSVIYKKPIQKIIEEEKMQASSMPEKQSELLEDIERQVIIDRLKRYHGNRKLTAKNLGIAKSTLHGKIRRWKKIEKCQWPVERFSF